MKPDDNHGAEVKPPDESAQVEIREVDQELNYDKGANLQSDTLRKPEVNAPDHSKIVPPGE